MLLHQGAQSGTGVPHASHTRPSKGFLLPSGLTCIPHLKSRGIRVGGKAREPPPCPALPFTDKALKPGEGLAVLPWLILLCPLCPSFSLPSPRAQRVDLPHCHPGLWLCVPHMWGPLSTLRLRSPDSLQSFRLLHPTAHSAPPLGRLMGITLSVGPN